MRPISAFTPEPAGSADPVRTPVARWLRRGSSVIRTVGRPRLRAVWVVSLVAVGLLAGCAKASGQGTLSGHLYMVGGPVVRGATPSPRPLAGKVVATGSAGSYTATVGPDGRYTMQLPPGTYSVTGTSPSYNGGTGICRTDGTVTIVLGREQAADVYCQAR